MSTSRRYFDTAPADLLVIDDQSSMPQLGANPSPAIGFELVQIAAIGSTIAVWSWATIGSS
jgi:hypothetical protein